MNLLPDSEQEQIADAVIAFLTNEAPVERLRPDKGGQIGNADHLLWPQIGELGFWSLSIPEEAGGAGLSLCEEYLMYREFGRHLVSLGALGITIGARIAAAGGEADLLAGLLEGKRRVAIATPRGTGSTIAAQSQGRFHLLEVDGADLVIAWSNEGAALFSIDQFTVGESVIAVDSHMTLARADLATGTRPLCWVPATQDQIRVRALALIAAYGVGLCEASRDMAVEYAKVREQFGQLIGKFQAIKHRCADMAIWTEVAYCQATYAALAVENGLADCDLQAIAASLLAVDVALRNGADNIQVHGAFGFTAEGDAHLYIKRGHVLEALTGGRRQQKQDLLRHAIAV